ncbi:hypothetical protein PF005_g1480 [Phytophthora fragariae]|uniref:Amine oxidase n=2 Tax=Phytophthora TaxID=4783 RepID=A0A6A3MG53_9STRA|nr:hypothetical protein PF009_g1175 [Phytophthora fragariae]KAE9015841.1 hypothetical protein PR002_g13825 [Phytophthora rubi]KAE9023562.1 hypothetical protein PR001_g12882 [Phytophthora rubi]KAE9029817.1 hypothetical protein PF011_g907 [Phytophthora fragariae]KAE9137771.1 hypothetical protein PF010_g1196 [Phytophthora fragariae]
MASKSAITLESSYRVAVIGAGLAGVSAANALLASNKFAASGVCVLEAQSRIGGRVQTQPFSDTLPVNVEVGAAWIHGTDGNPFSDLARKFGIAFKEVAPRNPWLHPGSCKNFLFFNGREQLPQDQVDETWQWQDLLMHKLQALATSPNAADHQEKALSAIVDHLVDSDGEFREAMKQPNARARLDVCLKLIEVWMGVNDDEVQLDDFAEIELIGDNAGAHCIVPAGMERFIDNLAEPVKGSIHTDVCVTSINYEGADGVVIECSDGRCVKADHVIVTSSLGFLKTGRLHFQPELPASKLGAIQRSKMGQYMKILVEFPESFWPEDSTFIAQLKDTSAASDGSDRRIYFPVVFNYQFAKGVPIIEGVLVGENASKISASFTDEEIAHALFLQLQETFGPNIPEPVNHFITRWDKDPWSVGAYSCLTVDSSDEDPAILRETVAKRVLFAGEATNYKYQGALQAAYLSGIQAAAELVGESK